MVESSERACAILGTLFPVLQNMVSFPTRPRPLEDRNPRPRPPLLLTIPRPRGARAHANAPAEAIDRLLARGSRLGSGWDRLRQPAVFLGATSVELRARRGAAHWGMASWLVLPCFCFLSHAPPFFLASPPPFFHFAGTRRPLPGICLSSPGMARACPRRMLARGSNPCPVSLLLQLLLFLTASNRPPQTQRLLPNSPKKRSLCTPDQKLKPVSSFSFSFFFSPPPPPPSSVPLLNGSVGRQIAHLDYNGKDWGALPCAAFAQRCASGFRATCSQAIQSTPLTPIVHLPPSVCGVHFAVESNDCWGFSQGRRRCSWALTHCVDTSSG